MKNKALLELDDVIFDALDRSQDERKQIYEGLEYLGRTRRERREVEIL